MAKTRKRVRVVGGTHFEGWLYGPNAAVVKMTAAEDGSTAWLHASIPGGRPLFSSDSPMEAATRCKPCSNAPVVERLADLLDFAVGRFA